MATELTCGSETKPCGRCDSCGGRKWVWGTVFECLSCGRYADTDDAECAECGDENYAPARKPCPKCTGPGLCETCGGRRKIYRVGRMIPCPDCAERSEG